MYESELEQSARETVERAYTTAWLIVDSKRCINGWTDSPARWLRGGTPAVGATLDDCLHPELVTAVNHGLETIESRHESLYSQTVSFTDGGEDYRIAVNVERPRSGFAENQYLVVFQGLAACSREALTPIDDSHIELRRIIDNIVSFLGVLDLDGTLVEANAPAIEAAGLQREDLIGKKFWDTYWWSHDELVAARLKKAIERARNGQLVRYDEVIRVANDQRIDIDFMLAPAYDKAGNVVRLIPSGVDISDRKRAEIRVHELLNEAINSSAKLQVLFDQSLYFVGTLDLDGVLTNVNETALKQCGYERATSVGKPFWETGWWSGSTEVQNEIRRGCAIAGQGQVYRRELPYWLADGTERIVQFAITPAVNDKNEVIFLVPSGLDITETRRVEQEIADRDSRFRTLADHIAQLAWMAEPAGQVTWYNQRWYDYTGTTYEQMSDGGWTAVHHPDDVQRVTQKINRAVQTNKAWEDVSRLRRHDGEYRWFLSRMTPIVDDDGQVIRWFGTSTDISKQKETEERLRSSSRQLRLGFEVAGFAVAEVNYQKDQILLSEGFAKMYGLPSDQLLVSRATVHSLFHPDDHAWLEAKIDAAIATEKDQILSLDHRIIRPDGETRWVSVRKQLINDTIDGKTVLRQSLVAAHDITDRKATEAELENARLLAESANQAKSDFLANMSHEIRSPMTAILGFAELLDAKSDKDREKVDTIRRNGQFLLELINDILDLSKIEAGKVEIDKIGFSPTQLIEEVCSLMSVRAAESQLNLKVVYDGPVPVQIHSDPVRLRQILINLVGNAIKFTEAGSVTLATRYRRESGEMQIDVIDTGIGISQQKQRKLFRPFEQGDSSMIRQYGGSGLGLAISQRLAELLNGYIRVESTPKIGSTFSLLMKCGDVVVSEPSDQPETTPDSAIELSQSVAAERTDGLSGVRVLVVDDRRDIRFLAQHLIEKWGGDVLLGENGYEALDLIEQETEHGRNIDIVLMDVQMPKMDGLTAVRTLRDKGFDRPIVALTANAMDSDREVCLEAGYNDHLSKPIDTDRLNETLRKYC